MILKMVNTCFKLHQKRMKIPQNYIWTLVNNKSQNFWQNPLNPRPEKEANANDDLGLTTSSHLVTWRLLSFQS